MKYCDIKKYLYSDGSFRDVYVFDMSLEDFEMFLSFVRPKLTESSFKVDECVEKLPESYSKVIDIREKSSCILEIPVGNSTLNCHFFDETELEFNFVPKDYDNEEDWAALDGFLRELLAVFRKNLVVTNENSPDEVLIRYDYKPD